MSKKEITSTLPIGRGERVKKIREILNISSEELARRVKFSRQSISYWENGRQNGLSYAGAEACVRVLKEADIECDVNWLLYGSGAEPYHTSEGMGVAKTAFDPIQDDYPNDERLEEMMLFNRHSQAICMAVKHNAMRPLYQKEDWVGGYWQPVLPKLIGQPCIVNLNDRLEVRLLKRRSAQGYDLSFMTYLGDNAEPFELKDQVIQHVAPIVRVWSRMRINDSLQLY